MVTDNQAGAERGVQHLISRGHRRIAFVGDLLQIQTAQQRYAGYLDAMRGADLRVVQQDTIHDCTSASLAEAAVTAMMRGDDPPTALFTAQNFVTFGALRALRHLGLQHRVAVVGFDDFALADLLDPGVTVVAQDAAAIGRRAAERLFSRFDGDDSPFTDRGGAQPARRPRLRRDPPAVASRLAPEARSGDVARSCGRASSPETRWYVVTPMWPGQPAGSQRGATRPAATPASSAAPIAPGSSSRPGAKPPYCASLSAATSGLCSQPPVTTTSRCGADLVGHHAEDVLRGRDQVLDRDPPDQRRRGLVVDVVQGHPVVRRGQPHRGPGPVEGQSLPAELDPLGRGRRADQLADPLERDAGRQPGQQAQVAGHHAPAGRDALARHRVDRVGRQRCPDRAQQRLRRAEGVEHHAVDGRAERVGRGLVVVAGDGEHRAAQLGRRRRPTPGPPAGRPPRSRRGGPAPASSIASASAHGALPGTSKSPVRLTSDSSLTWSPPRACTAHSGTDR